MECPFCTLDADSLSGQIPRQPGACAGGAQAACDAGEGVGEPEYPIEIVLAIYPPINRHIRQQTANYLPRCKQEQEVQ